MSHLLLQANINTAKVCIFTEMNNNMPKNNYLYIYLHYRTHLL